MKPDLNLFNPFASCISNDSASLSSKLSAVTDSILSIRSFNLPISLMVNLCVFSLLTLTSVGLNVNGGISISANFIALSRSFGDSGNSAEAPSIILNSPSIAKNTDAFLAR